ncbi:hypothetical protein B0H16DRAFT_1465394 [Mycena metata]|uniref:Uncharacterized protein n=1 Tax=Mycena metata TaxID=1033252 RepID=A0AAD7ICE9_9AGAR|nr:hypothetical protein B0H16DRAFT_1465394 [Mycena metata]
MSEHRECDLPALLETFYLSLPEVSVAAHDQSYCVLQRIHTNSTVRTTFAPPWRRNEAGKSGRRRASQWWRIDDCGDPPADALNVEIQRTSSRPSPVLCIPRRIPPVSWTSGNAPCRRLGIQFSFFLPALPPTRLHNSAFESEWCFRLLASCFQRTMRVEGGRVFGDLQNGKRKTEALWVVPGDLKPLINSRDFDLVGEPWRSHGLVEEGSKGRISLITGITRGPGHVRQRQLLQPPSPPICPRRFSSTAGGAYTYAYPERLAHAHWRRSPDIGSKEDTLGTNSGAYSATTTTVSATSIQRQSQQQHSTPSVSRLRPRTHTHAYAPNANANAAADIDAYEPRGGGKGGGDARSRTAVAHGGCVAEGDFFSPLALVGASAHISAHPYARCMSRSPPVYIVLIAHGDYRWAKEHVYCPLGIFWTAYIVLWVHTSVFPPRVWCLWARFWRIYYAFERIRGAGGHAYVLGFHPAAAVLFAHTAFFSSTPAGRLAETHVAFLGRILLAHIPCF